MVAVTSAPHRPAAVLEAVLERLTYVNEETRYTVARVATDRSADLLTVVGALLAAQPGESLRLVGRWSSHPQYGRQFEVASYTTVLPATIQGIRRYLGSGLVKGIGPVFADRIVTHFGLDTLRVIEQEPARLVLDNVQDARAEMGHHPLGHHRADPLDQPRPQVAADALDRGRQHGGIGMHLELPAIPGVAAPPPGQPQAFPDLGAQQRPHHRQRSGPVRSVATRAMVYPVSSLA